MRVAKMRREADVSAVDRGCGRSHDPIFQAGFFCPNRGCSRRDLNPMASAQGRRVVKVARMRHEAGKKRGATRIRTGVDGFADRSLATWVWHQWRRKYNVPSGLWLGSGRASHPEGRAALRYNWLRQSLRERHGCRRHRPKGSPQDGGPGPTQKYRRRGGSRTALIAFEGSRPGRRPNCPYSPKAFSIQASQASSHRSSTCSNPISPP